MNSFLNYILESGVSLGMLSLVYFLFLRKETFYRANRLYLLFAVLFSSILPLLHLKIYGTGNVILANPTEDDAVNMLEMITVNASGFSHSLIDLISTSQLLLFAYFLGSGLTTILILFRIGQIVRVISKGKVVQKAGIKFVYIEGNSSPYSFLNYLFVSEELENNSGWEKMLTHESEHIRQGHTVDILLLEFISIFQWFNPFFWLLRRVIKENHEFMADRAVLDNGVTLDLYKKILVGQYIGQQFSMANNFNSSLIKTRLKMMTKIKSSKFARFRFLGAGIMAIALLLVFACENKDTSVVEPSADQQGVQIRSTTGGGQPLVLIDGEIADKDAMDKLDPNSIESVDVLKATNSAIIEKYGELAKNGVIKITLKYGATDAKKNTIDGVTAVAYGQKSSTNNDPVFQMVDKMPEFPGGELALRKYIARNIKYPVDASKEGIQGKVYVNFVVEKDGSVGRIRVVRGVDPLLDAEAIRVAKAMPSWTPGEQRGEKVAVAYTVPINFVLQ